MKFYYVRHGESDANAAGIVGTPHAKLTENEIEQARRTGYELGNLNIKTVICSPYIRAQQTAEIIAGELGIELKHIQIIDNLSERDFGKAEGNPKINENIWFYECDDAPGLEPRQALLDRSIEALEKIKELISKDENVVVVGHAVSGFYLLQVAKGNTKLDMFDEHFQLSNADFVEVDVLV